MFIKSVQALWRPKNRRMDCRLHIFIGAARSVVISQLLGFEEGYICHNEPLDIMLKGFRLIALSTTSS
jgi:hypothetical protein